MFDVTRIRTHDPWHWKCTEFHFEEFCLLSSKFGPMTLGIGSKHSYILKYHNYLFLFQAFQKTRYKQPQFSYFQCLHFNTAYSITLQLFLLLKLQIPLSFCNISGDKFMTIRSDLFSTLVPDPLAKIINRCTLYWIQLCLQVLQGWYTYLF